MITGGTTGIGFATARCLAAKGSRVVIAGRDGTRGERAIDALRAEGADAVFVRTDVAHDDQVAALAAAAAGDGTIDIWFNNAGIEGVPGPIEVVGAKAPVPIAVAYGGTKAAVVSMTRSAAVALGGRGISVFGICAFIVDTPMVDRLTGGAGPEARARFAAQFAPSGRLTTPDDVGMVVADLVSGTESYPSGTVLSVDAGPSVELMEP